MKSQNLSIFDFISYICNMKKGNKALEVQVSENESDKKQEFLLGLFNELFVKRIKEEEKELDVLVDKFEIHTKGKEILLENSCL